MNFKNDTINAESNKIKTHDIQQYYKYKEILIVSLFYASSQPNTVMIKPHYTIITHITVSCSLWAKYHTSFTKFHPIYLVFVLVKIEYSRIFIVYEQVFA